MQVRLIKCCKKVTSETNTVKIDMGSICHRIHRISNWEVTFMLSDGRQNTNNVGEYRKNDIVVHYQCTRMMKMEM